MIHYVSGNSIRLNKKVVVFHYLSAVTHTTKIAYT